MTVTKPYTSEGSTLVFAPHLGNQRSVSRAGPFQLRRGTGNRNNSGIAPCSNCREREGRLCGQAP